MAITALNNLSADTSRKRSPNVWNRFTEQTLQRIKNGDINGVVMEYDFLTLDVPVLVTPTITTQAIYGAGLKAFGSAGGTLVSGGGAEGGTLVMTETDDDQGIGIATVALPFKIINTYGDFAFECRLKTNSITDTDHGFVCGLWESQTLSATVPIAAAGTLADANFVGFHRLEGDGDQIDTVYKANGVTQVSAADQLHTALVADTYTKLGMSYDHNDGYFRFFQNNKELATKYALPSAAGTDFPNDVFMGLCVALLCASNNDAIVTIDWIRAAQVYDPVGPY